MTLSAGESLQVDATIVVSHPVVDFFDETTHKPVFSNLGIQTLSAAALPPRRESRLPDGRPNLGALGRLSPALCGLPHSRQSSESPLALA